MPTRSLYTAFRVSNADPKCAYARLGCVRLDDLTSVISMVVFCAILNFSTITLQCNTTCGSSALIIELI
jgi:hypothetical protein